MKKAICAVIVVVLQVSELGAVPFEWFDNRNIMADAVRDMCIQAVADATGKEFADVLKLIEARAEDLQ